MLRKIVKRKFKLCSVMSLMMNGIANTVLILIALPILGRCSFALTSLQNGTHASNLMFIADDVECLAQMPVTDLMKIRNTIKMMHAVSTYDALHRHPTHATELDINDQSQNQNQNRSDSDSDTALRELDEPVAETKHIFKYLSRFTTSTTKSPLAEAYMMTGQMHDELMKQQYQQQLTHKTGWASEWEEEKPSKVQKVLHYSITALTFLAFAGYLLCMIVQAIKSKGTTYYHPSMTMMAQTPVKLQSLQPGRYRRNAKFIDRITIAEPDPISMFEALATVSKGYVQLSNLLQPPN